MACATTLKNRRFREKHVIFKQRISPYTFLEIALSAF